MKLVTAIIKPFKLNEVCQMLTSLGLEGMTVTEVKGYSRQKGHTEIYRGGEHPVKLIPKMEVVVAPENVDKTISAISVATKTGQIGDDKISVSPIENSVRIRTDETDTSAI